MTFIDCFLRRFGGGMIVQYLDTKSIAIDIEQGGFVVIRNLSLPIEISHPIVPLNLKSCKIGCVKVCAEWRSALRYNPSEKLRVEVTDLTLDIGLIDFGQWSDDELLEFLEHSKKKLLRHWENAFKTFGNFSLFEKIGFNVANSLAITCTNITINFNVDLEGFSGYIVRISIPELLLGGCDKLAGSELYGVRNSLLIALSINLSSVSISFAQANRAGADEIWIEMTTTPFDCEIGVRKWSPRALGMKPLFKRHNFFSNPAVGVTMSFSDLNFYLNSQVLDLIFSISGYFYTWSKWQYVLKDMLAARPSHTAAARYVKGQMGEAEKLKFERECPIEMLFRLINSNNKWFKYALHFCLKSGPFTISSDTARAEATLELTYKIYEKNSSKLFLTIDKIFIVAISKSVQSDGVVVDEFPIVYSSSIFQGGLVPIDGDMFELTIKQYTDHVTAIDIKVPRLTLALGNALAVITFFPSTIGAFDRIRKVIDELSDRKQIPMYKNRSLIKVQMLGVDLVAVFAPLEAESPTSVDKFAQLREYKYPYYLNTADVLSTDSSDNETSLQLVDRDQFLASHQISLHSPKDPFDGESEPIGRKFITCVNYAARLNTIHTHVYTDQIITFKSNSTASRCLAASLEDFVIFSDKKINHLSFALESLSLSLGGEIVAEMEKFRMAIYQIESSATVKSIILTIPTHLVKDVFLNLSKRDYLKEQVVDKGLEFYHRIDRIVKFFELQQEWSLAVSKEHSDLKAVSQALTLCDSGIEYPESKPANPKVKMSTKLKVHSLSLCAGAPNDVEISARKLSLDLAVQINGQASACIKAKYAKLSTGAGPVLLCANDTNFLQFDLSLQRLESLAFQYDVQSALSISSPVLDPAHIGALTDSIAAICGAVPQLKGGNSPWAQGSFRGNVAQALCLARIRLTATVDDLVLILQPGPGDEVFLYSRARLKALYDLATGPDSVPPPFIDSDGMARHLLVTVEETRISLKRGAMLLYIAEIKEVSMQATLLASSYGGKESVEFRPRMEAPIPTLSAVEHQESKSPKTPYPVGFQGSRYRDIVRKIKIAMRLGGHKQPSDANPVETDAKPAQLVQAQMIGNIGSSGHILYAAELIATRAKVWAIPDRSTSRGVRGTEEGLNLLIENVSGDLLRLQACGLLGLDPAKCVMTLSVVLGQLCIYLDSRPLIIPCGNISSRAGSGRFSSAAPGLGSSVPVTVWAKATVEGIRLHLPPPRVSSLESDKKFSIYQLEMKTSLYGLASGACNETDVADLWKQRHLVTCGEWRNLRIAHNTYTEMHRLFCTMAAPSHRLVALLSAESFTAELQPPPRLADRLPHLRLLSDCLNGTAVVDRLTRSVEAECKIQEFQLYCVLDGASQTIINDSSALSDISIAFYGSGAKRSLSLSLVDIQVVIELELIEKLLALGPSAPRANTNNTATTTTTATAAPNPNRRGDADFWTSPTPTERLGGLEVSINASRVALWLVRKQRTMSDKALHIHPAVIEQAEKLLDYECQCADPVNDLSGLGASLSATVNLSEDGLVLDCSGLSLYWGAPNSALYNVEILSFSDLTAGLTRNGSSRDVDVLVDSITVRLPLLIAGPALDFLKALKKMARRLVPAKGSSPAAPGLPAPIRMNAMAKEMRGSVYSGISSLDSTLLARLSLHGAQVALALDAAPRPSRVAVDAVLALDGWNDLRVPFAILHRAPLSLALTLYCGGSTPAAQTWSASAELGAVSLVLSYDLCRLLRHLSCVVPQRVGSSECLVYNELEQLVGLDLIGAREPVLVPRFCFRRVNLPLSHVFNANVLFINEAGCDRKIFDRKRAKLLLYGNTNDVSSALAGHRFSGDKIWGPGTSLPVVAPIIHPGSVPCLVVGSILRVENRTRMTLSVLCVNDAVTKTFNTLNAMSGANADAGNGNEKSRVEQLVLQENCSSSVPISWLQAGTRAEISNESGDVVRLPDLNSLAFGSYRADKWPVVFSKTCGVSARLDFTPSWGTRPRCLVLEPMVRCHNHLPWPIKICVLGNDVRTGKVLSIRPLQFAGLCWGESKPLLTVQAVLPGGLLFEGRAPVALKEGSKVTRCLTCSDSEEKIPIVIAASRHVLSVFIPVLLRNLMNAPVFVNHRALEPEEVVHLSVGDATALRISTHNPTHSSSHGSIHNCGLDRAQELPSSLKVNLLNPVRGGVLVDAQSVTSRSIGWSLWALQSQLPLNSTLLATIHSLFCITNSLPNDVFVRCEGESVPILLRSGSTVETSHCSTRRITVLDVEGSQEFNFEYAEREECIQRLLGPHLIDVTVGPLRTRRSLSMGSCAFVLQKTCAYEITLELAAEPRFILFNNTCEALTTSNCLSCGGEYVLGPGERCILDVPACPSFSLRLSIASRPVVIPCGVSSPAPGGGEDGSGCEYAFQVTRRGSRRLYVGAAPRFDGGGSDLGSSGLARGSSLGERCRALGVVRVSAARLTLTLVDEAALAALHLIGMSASLDPGPSASLRATVSSLHVDHFIPGGGIPAIVQTSNVDSADPMPFLDLILRCASSGDWEGEKLAMEGEKLANFVELLSVKVAPVCINIEFTVIKRLLSALRRMLPLLGSVASRLQPRPPSHSGAQGWASSYLHFGLVEVSPLSTAISIRTGGQEPFQELFALKLLEWLPLDTPKINFNLNGEKVEKFCGTPKQLAKRLGSGYIKQLLRQSIPSVWLSYPLAFLLGVLRALGALFATPARLINAPISKDSSRPEAALIGARLGIMLSMPYVVGGAFQTLGHTLNMLHKICGGQKVTPVGIIDSLWLSVNGMLADIFYYPWVGLRSEKLAFSNGVGISLLGYALCCVRCAACPILGLINLLTTICEGFSNTLIGDFEHFAHLSDTPDS
ncbi:hypothetical protein BmR1_04g08600 [Babesia microti strain RI]|uniref:Uncharacterized protein n=1 Tax=Babesia microti (strain RI) TaxID=1133968 RepID=A0A1N6LY97_BABMR|nr:hypothetical protein BmR1_04g08600 [Babesia microti strain RI]SIO73824.1 hypothetical protein BmR1_04g08600 [Babesia microti strain RI]|eukprot:XP_012650305.2 hypothetical protein BmR1_04g08600 [Babesia microti strain RI]